MRNIAPDVYRLWPDLTSMAGALRVPATDLVRLKADDMLPDEACDGVILRRARSIGRKMAQRDLREHRLASTSLDARRDIIKALFLALGGVQAAADRVGVSRRSLDLCVHRGNLAAKHARVWLDLADDAGLVLPKWIFTALPGAKGGDE